MKELTQNQAKKLVEENLNNKFRHYLENMRNEKRPFGNSGNSSIIRDIQSIASLDKKWIVSDDAQLDALMHEFMNDCFDDVNDWVEENRDKLEIKLCVLSELDA